MNSRLCTFALCSSAAVVAIFPLKAKADFVGPGETIQYNGLSDDNREPNPQFDLVARTTRDVTFDYGLGNELTFTFENEVLRNPADQHLTFLFGPTQPIDQGFTERWEMMFQNAGTQPVNVHSDTALSIHDDAGALSLQTTEPGIAGDPYLLLDTTATHFDAKGVLTLTGHDEFAVQGAFGGVEGLSATHTFEGVYQPVFKESPATVPLPPAAYGGLAILAGIVITRIRRRA